MPMPGVQQGQNTEMQKRLKDDPRFQKMMDDLEPVPAKTSLHIYASPQRENGKTGGEIVANLKGPW